MQHHEAAGLTATRSVPYASGNASLSGGDLVGESRTLTFLVQARTIEVVVTATPGPHVASAGRPAAMLVNPVLLQEVLEQEGRFGARDFDAAVSVVGRDAVADALIRALATASTLAGDDESLKSIGTALVVRSLALFRGGADILLRKGRRTPMPKWRLNRVVEHIEANLDRSISLSEMADVAGLTRIYFAAQFRRTTGTSPHSFLLRRRVERAKDLLRSSNQPLADVALAVGFSTQAHFTTVFKRHAGDTPHRWRQSARIRPLDEPMPT